MMALAGGTNADHLETVVVVEQRFALLERVLWRYDKPDLVDVGQFKHRVGNDKVPHVDGVERAEE